MRAKTPIEIFVVVLVDVFVPLSYVAIHCWIQRCKGFVANQYTNFLEYAEQESHQFVQLDSVTCRIALSFLSLLTPPPSKKQVLDHFSLQWPSQDTNSSSLVACRCAFLGQDRYQHSEHVMSSRYRRRFLKFCVGQENMAFFALVISETVLLNVIPKMTLLILINQRWTSIYGTNTTKYIFKITS